MSCRHHLYLDVNPETGSIKFNFPDTAVEDLGDSCALDVADRGEHTLAVTATLLNVTRQGLALIEADALEEVRAKGEALDG